MQVGNGMIFTRAGRRDSLVGAMFGAKCNSKTHACPGALHAAGSSSVAIVAGRITALVV